MKAKAITIILIASLAIAVVSSVAVNRSQGKQANSLWLSHFVSSEVIVTFMAAPPGMSRSVKALLMDAELPGIVLKIGGNEIFFSYANVISVEPVL